MNIDNFFFQAEDGIRARNVTGVQTCALPIFDVGGEARHDPADRVPIEEAHREALHAREERDAEVGEAPLRDHHGQVLLPVGGQQLADDGAEVEEAEAAKPARVAALHVAVDAELHQVGLHLLEELVDGREEQREADDAPVGPHVDPQAPEEARVVRLAELLLAVDLGRHQIASSSTSSACWRKRSAYTPPRASRLSWSPSSTTRPSSSTQIRSASFTVVKRCATRMVVRSRKKPRSWSRMVRSVSASTLESASSRTSTRGAAASTRASATRCFCPPESVTPRSPTIVSRPWGNSVRSRASAAMRTAQSTCPSPSPSSARPTFSRVVREKRKGSWGTSPTWRRSQPSGSVRMSRPSSRMLPASTSKRRGRSWTSADFPAPVRPTIATVRPAGTVRSTASSTGVRAGRPRSEEHTS